MKYAPWAALVLLIVTICSTMWIVMGIITHLLLPLDVRRPLGASMDVSILSGIVCMVVPFTSGACSFVLWRVSRRQQRALAVAAPGELAWPGSPPPPAPASVPMPAAAPVAHAPVQPAPAPASVLMPAAAPVARAPVQPAPAPAPARPLPQIRQALSQTMILEAYMAEITELLIAPNEDEQPAARLAAVQARTRQVLHGLDATHRARVLQVLHSGGWLNGAHQVQLHDVDLSGIDLRFADLRQARLVGVNLRGAHLVGANLSGANLSGANLSGADLRLAHLDQARLYQASLQRARLHRSCLRGAVLHGAELHQANLWHADLTQAQVTAEQLKQAVSLNGAVMPDGTRHS